MFSISTDRCSSPRPDTLKHVRALGLFHTKADIGIQFAEQAVTQVTGSHKLTFLTGERAVIYNEVAWTMRRLRNLLERNRFRMLRRT